MLAVNRIVLRLISIVIHSTASRNASASSAARCRSALGSRMPNSSPPSRAVIPASPIVARQTAAKLRSASSPA